MTNIKESNEYQIYYEHTITNYEHQKGTNEYVFKFPDHWIQYPSKQHLVALRNVNQHVYILEIMKIWVF